MKSICIKTNNSEIIKYSIEYFKSITFNTIYYTSRTFKYYYNFIIHYVPSSSTLSNSFSLDSFYDLIANYIYDVIINFYEKKIVSSNIEGLYFYFEDYEKEEIINNCLSDLELPKNEEMKKSFLFPCIYEYLLESKSIFLDGFFNFRIKSYSNFINEILHESINDFIIQKEYYEYINLLKKYVNSQHSNCSIVHVIYIDSDTILLDENLEIISIANNTNTPKSTNIVSDISFASNDYVLNTLLSLLPDKIFIHLLTKEDLFIETLELIFESHIHICKSCSICEAYSFLNNSYKKK